MESAAKVSETKLQTIIRTLSKCAKDYGVIIAIAIYLIVLSTQLSTDTNELYSKKYLYALSIVIPVIIGFGYLMYISDIKLDPKEIGKLIAAVVVFVGAIYLFNEFKVSDSILTSLSFMSNIIILSIVIFAAIVFAKVFKDIAYSIDGPTGIIIRLLFFIPCAISDFFDYLMGQMSKSPFVVYALLLIEALLIILYFYLPKIIQMYSQKGGYKLLDKPELLKYEKRIISYSELMKAENIVTNSIAKIKNEYAFSMWFYVVKMPKNQSPYNTDATIFEFVNQHPKILYNGNENLCKIQFSPTLADKVSFKITTQKWVHCVVNYSVNSVDVFINGELVKTASRTNNDVTEISDYIVTGQESGLQGGICNIMHYNQSLLKMEVDALYENNKESDPPTN